MNKTVLMAKENGVLVGAHPSLPDMQGFGRREMAIEPVSLVYVCIMHLCMYFKMQNELAECFIYQVGALLGFLKRHDLPLNHVSIGSFPLLRLICHAYLPARSNPTVQSTAKHLDLFLSLAQP